MQTETGWTRLSKIHKKWDKDPHTVCSQDCEDIIGGQGLDEFTKKHLIFLELTEIEY